MAEPCRAGDEKRAPEAPSAHLMLPHAIQGLALEAMPTRTDESPAEID